MKANLPVAAVLALSLALAGWRGADPELDHPRSLDDLGEAIEWRPGTEESDPDAPPACATCRAKGQKSAEGGLERVGNPLFMSPHAGPIAHFEDFVYVVNTAADTLDVIDSRRASIVRRIPVGVDPVGVAVRPNGLEVWVANHVSDSVSVIDIDPASATRFQIVATVQEIDPDTGATRFDEPVGIAFAGTDKAYVSLSSENRIAVVDARSKRVMGSLTVTAQDPRALFVHGERLFVLPFESGNQTQISGCVGPLDGDLCTFDALEHVVDNNNVLSLGIDVDLVRNPRVPDRDLYVFDTTNDRLVEIVESLGTLLYGLAVDSSGRVFIAQTDARNDANGRAGTLKHGLAEMENRAFLNRITRLDCGSGPCTAPEFLDLEPLPPVHPQRGQALATPFAIQVSGDGSTLVASAAGSDMVFTMDAATGQILGRVEVDAVPRGIALESSLEGAPLRAWVFNAVANSVSLIDVSDPTAPRVRTTIRMKDPTPRSLKRGRIAFHDADASSTDTFSCESCHPDGHTDQLLWVLDTPICSLPGCTQIPPRTTMPVRGLRNTAPYHWDGIPGDPYGGRNTANITGSDAPNCSRDDPESCTRSLVDGSLATTMCQVGECGNGRLSGKQRRDLARFLLNVPYPPAQRRSYTNVLSERAATGFRLFHIEGQDQGEPQPNVCGECHRMPYWVSTNTPGTGMEAPTWRGAYDRWLILPQGRLNVIDLMDRFGVSAPGFPERRVWRLSWAADPQFDPVWDMVLEGSTGFSGAFARQVTLERTTAAATATLDLLKALELAAADGAVVLEGEGVFLEGGVATPVELQYDAGTDGRVYLNRNDPAESFDSQELITHATSGRLLVTFTARAGAETGFGNPQPVLWTRSALEAQGRREIFPTVSSEGLTVAMNARHVRPGAGVFIDGRRVAGTVTCREGTLPKCNRDEIEVRLEELPQAAPVAPTRLRGKSTRRKITLRWNWDEVGPAGGMHFLQVQNPNGHFSNDFILFTDVPSEEIEGASDGSFEIQRRSKGGAGFETVAIVEAEARSLRDKKLEPGTKYLYRIRRLDGPRFSEWSKPKRIKTKR